MLKSLMAAMSALVLAVSVAPATASAECPMAEKMPP